MKRINKKIIIFIILIGIITVCRYLLVCDLPVLANAILGADDALMIRQAATIIDGQWLGQYSETTLLKGVAFPLFLAICYFWEIRYISAITILYIIACLTMIFAISKVIRSKIALLCIYILLLFNPIMFSSQIMQRVYRSSIIPPLALFLIACYINLFLLTNSENKFLEKILTVIFSSIALPFLWFAREDSIWIMPFIIFIILASLVSTLVRNKKLNKYFFKTFAMLFIPILVTCLAGNIICLKNYKEYGAYTTNNKYYYNKAISSMKKVKSLEQIDKVTFTREKLNRIAEVTILSEIMENFNPLLDAYAKFDGNQEDNQVQNGWFGFPFREALRATGYYSDVNATNKFFLELHTQIEEALESGKLEKEDKEKYNFEFIKKLIKTIYECTKYVLTYDEIDLDVAHAEPYAEQLSEIYKNYSKITGNKFIYKKDDNINKNEFVVSFVKQDMYLESIKYKNDIINFIIEIYRKITIPLFIIAIMYYIYSSIKLIITIKSKEFYGIQNWAILSGILGAAFTIICGISLETVQNARVISDLYLCGVYPLILAFSLISVYNGGVEIYKKIKCK